MYIQQRISNVVDFIASILPFVKMPGMDYFMIWASIVLPCAAKLGTEKQNV